MARDPRSGASYADEELEREAQLAAEQPSDEDEPTAGEADEDAATGDEDTAVEATPAYVADLKAELRRIESRLDKGGNESSSVKEMRRAIADIREELTFLAESTLDPEVVEKRKSARREAELKAREEALAERERGGQQPDIDPEMQELAEELNQIFEDAGYDPHDQSFIDRLKAKVPGYDQMSLRKRFAAFSRAVVQLQREDAAGTTGETDDERRAARQRTARSNGRASASRAVAATRRYTSENDIRGALARGEITAREARDAARSQGITL